MASSKSAHVESQAAALARARRHLLIRAFNARGPTASLRDQFRPLGPASSSLRRAEIVACLLPPSSKASVEQRVAVERRLGVVWEALEGAVGAGREEDEVDAEAFLRFLETGAIAAAENSSGSASECTALLSIQRHGVNGYPLPSPSRLPLLLLLTAAESSPSPSMPPRPSPQWRKREVVLQERLVEYTTVDAAGTAQSLWERERTRTEVLHWECPGTGEVAHRERIAYEQCEALDGAPTGAAAGEEEYVHLQNGAEGDEYESLHSTLPPQYFESKERERVGGDKAAGVAAAAAAAAPAEDGQQEGEEQEGLPPPQTPPRPPGRRRQQQQKQVDEEDDGFRSRRLSLSLSPPLPAAAPEDEEEEEGEAAGRRPPPTRRRRGAEEGGLFDL